MTRLEYDLLRDQEPQLRLPRWEFLQHQFQSLVGNLKRDELVARRTAVLLGRDWPQMDEAMWGQYLFTR